MPIYSGKETHRFIFVITFNSIKRYCEFDDAENLKQGFCPILPLRCLDNPRSDGKLAVAVKGRPLASVRRFYTAPDMKYV